MNRHQGETLHALLMEHMHKGTPRFARARRFAQTVQAMLQDFLPRDRDCARRIEEYIIEAGFAVNAEIINVPPECDALDKLELERARLEHHMARIGKDRQLADLKIAAEAFRVVIIESGAVDHVRQDLYIDQLRALEKALNPVNYGGLLTEAPR